MIGGKDPKVYKNLLFNFTGSAIPILVTIFTVPIYLKYVGASRYGVILVAWSLLGYFGFLDFGISRATTNALAKLAHIGEHSAKERVFWSSLLINACLGLFGGLIFYFAGSFLFLNVIKIAPDVQVEALASMQYIAAMLPVALMLGVGVGTAEAHENFGMLNVIQSAGLVLGQALPLMVVILWGPSLTLIMPVMLLVRTATFVTVVSYAIRLARIRWRPIIDFQILRNLLSFGGWVTVTNLVSPIMSSIDQFVISAVWSVTMVPFYAVPLNIVTRTQIIPAALTRTLFPIFSRLGKDEGTGLMTRVLNQLAIVMTLVYCCGILAGAPFLELWLGKQMMLQGAPVFRTLCIGAFANSLAFVVYSALQGQGRPRAVAIIHSCEVLPYVALMWVLVHHFGILGSAMAWSLRAVVDAVLLGGAARVDVKVLATLLPSIACLAASYGLAMVIGPALLPSSIAALGIMAIYLGITALTNPGFRLAVENLLIKGRSLRKMS